MTATIEFNYNQILNIVRQLPVAEKMRLTEEMFLPSELGEYVSFGPNSADEAISRIDAVESEILSKKTCLAEEMETRMETKYPWLCM